MPITPDEFKRKKEKGSLEDLVLDVLSDGNAHTQSEIEKELGIGQRNTDSPLNATDEQKATTSIELFNNFMESLNFRGKLEDMEKAGRIKSAYIEGKNGFENKYYIRTEFDK